MKDGKTSRILGVFQDITEGKQAEEEIRHQLNQLAALHTIDLAIAGSTDVKLVLQVILDQMASLMRLDAADILLFNPIAQVLEYANGIGFRAEALQHTRRPLGDGYAGRAVLERQMVHVPDLQNQNTDFLSAPTLSQEGFVSYYAVPLIAKGQIQGVLEIYHRTAFEAEPEWLNFLNTLAGQTAI